MPERGTPNSNNSLDVGSLLPFDKVGEVVEGSRAKLHVPPPKATMERPCLFSWWGPVCKFSFPKAAWKHKWEDQFHNLRAPLLKSSTPWKEVPLALDQLS